MDAVFTSLVVFYVDKIYAVFVSKPPLEAV